MSGICQQQQQKLPLIRELLFTKNFPLIVVAVEIRNIVAFGDGEIFWNVWF